MDAPDPATVVIHLKQPDAALLWNLSDGAIGIVPVGSGRDFAFHPVGSGPFRFVSQLQDDEVILERNENSWQPRPAIARIRFAVVPDAITRALELEKGSADVCINCMTADMVSALAKRPNLQVEDAPGTNLNYITFNAQDSVLRDVRVRQAIAYAMNRPLIIHSLMERPRPPGGEPVAAAALGMDRGSCSSILTTQPRQTRCSTLGDGGEAKMEFVSTWR